MIAGFEELLLQCKEDASRSHIREAIRCYESSAYRAAIVTSYMAVCFDLIAKLKALSANGDSKAKSLVDILSQLQTQLDNGNAQAIVGLLNFERELIEHFRDDFEFFGVNEFDDLSRLRSDRNRCAHPTFLKTEVPYEPSAEQARLHIRNALTLVLIQEPRQGKAALSEFQAIILSKYFPDDTKGAIARLEAAGIKSGRDALIRAIVDDIIFGLATSNHPYFGKMSPYIALDAIIEINRSVSLPRAVLDVDKLLLRTEDISIEVGSVFSLRNDDIANEVSSASRLAIAAWLSKTDYNFVASAVRIGLTIPWLVKAAEIRLQQLTAKDLGGLRKNLSPIILQRAAELYANARNWDDANSLAENCAIPLADRFQDTNIDYIFNEARNGKADLIGSHGFREFIKKLYQENPIGKEILDELTEKYDLENYRPEEK